MTGSGGFQRVEMEGLMITIHVEPEGKAKHRGVLVLEAELSRRSGLPNAGVPDAQHGLEPPPCGET